MQTATNRYLDAVQKRLNLPSDYALAKYWGITRQRISHYRSGESALGEDRCIQVAEILDLPPENVLLEIQAERARKAGNAKVSEVLENVLRRLAASPATYVFCAMAIGLIFGNSISIGDAENLSVAALGIVRVNFTDNVNYANYAIPFSLLFWPLFSRASLKICHSIGIACSCFYYSVS